MTDRIARIARRVMHQIQETMDLIRYSRNLQTRLRRCEFLHTCCDRLEALPTDRPGAIYEFTGKIRRMVPALRDGAIADEVMVQARIGEQRITRLGTAAARARTAARVEARLRGLALRLSDPSRANALLARIVALRDMFEHNDRFEAAWQREVAGQGRKALDGYEAARASLHADRTPDAEQQAMFDVLDARIRDLRAALSLPP